MDTSGVSSALAPSSQSAHQLNLTAAAYELWNRIKSQLGYSSDSDTACFLIQLYLGRIAGIVSALSCSVCQISLALYCPQCKDNYTLSNVSLLPGKRLSSDRPESDTFASPPLQPQKMTCVMIKQECIDSKDNKNQTEDLVFTKADDIAREPYLCNNVMAASETSKFYEDEESPLRDIGEEELTVGKDRVIDVSHRMSITSEQVVSKYGIKWTKKVTNCPLCGVRVTQNHLKAHMRIHTGERPYQCDICSKSFSLKATLKRHRQRHNPEPTFICNECGSAFFVSADLREHVKTHALIRPFPCSLCSKSFKRSGDRSVHMRNHTGSKPFLCQDCGKRFTTSPELKKHRMSKHMDLKPFECQDCQKRFTFAKSLELHRVRHTGEKNFLCTICGAKFAHKATLTRHFGLHTASGERPYQCEVENCGKGFVFKSELLMHHRRSHGEGVKKTKSSKKKKTTSSAPDDHKKEPTISASDDLKKEPTISASDDLKKEPTISASDDHKKEPTISASVDHL